MLQGDGELAFIVFARLMLFCQYCVCKIGLAVSL